MFTTGELSHIYSAKRRRQDADSAPADKRVRHAKIPCPCMDLDPATAVTGGKRISHTAACSRVFGESGVKQMPWIQWDDLYTRATTHTDLIPFANPMETSGNRANPDADEQESVYRVDPGDLMQSIEASADDVGMIRLARAIDIINFLGKEDSRCNKMYSVNIDMLKIMFNMVIPYLVGVENYNANPMRYQKAVRMKVPRMMFFARCARQVGKTTTASLVMATFMCLVDDPEAAIVYARVQTQSIIIIKQTLQLFKLVPDKWRPEILSETQLGFSVCPLFNLGGISTLWARTQVADSARGARPSVIIVDESEFCFHSLYTDMLFPVLLVGGRCMIAISTPGNAALETARMVTGFFENPEKHPTVLTRNYSHVCAAHRRAGKATECWHRFDLLPPWKDPARLAQTRAQMICDGRDDKFIVEVMGEPLQSDGTLFTSGSIESWQTRERVADRKIEPRHKTVYITVDPASGGPSKLAITSSYFRADRNDLVIIGLDEIDLRQQQAHDQIAAIEYHTTRLVQTAKRIWDCPIQVVPVVERGGNDLACNSFVSGICKAARKAGAGLSLMFSKQNGKSIRPHAYTQNAVHGVDTNDVAKQNMAMNLHMRLSTDSIWVSSALFSVGRPPQPGQQQSAERPPNPETMLKTVCAQLKRMIMTDKKKITGKTDSGLQDDMAMSLMMCALHTDRAREIFDHGL